jgi:hypothetical protein
LHLQFAGFFLSCPTSLCNQPAICVELSYAYFGGLILLLVALSVLCDTVHEMDHGIITEL